MARVETSARRHLILLVALIVALVGQPMLAGQSGAVSELSDVALGLVYIGVLLVVFVGHRHRSIAVGLFIPAVVTNLATYAVPASGRTPAGAAFHCTVLAFLAYTVSTILRDLFGRSVIKGDDVLGAVCGYLLGGMAWAHLYALAYMVAPQAFSVSEGIASQLNDPHSRQELFNYFSFTTLTSIGFSDITPVGPTVYSLVWLEVMFGQFYMAVVVAQLVGLKLAQTITRNDARQP